MAAPPPGHASIRLCACFETTKRVADVVGESALKSLDELASRVRTAAAARKLDDILGVSTEYYEYEITK